MAKRTAVWKADWFFALAVVLLILVLSRATTLVEGLELRYYDFGVSSASKTPSDRVAIIAIDDQSIANIGRWPWPRDVQAKLIDQLTAAQAKVVANTVFFFEPQRDRGLDYIAKLKEALGPVAESNEAAQKVFAEAQATLDTDAVMAASMGKSQNVLLSTFFTLGEPLGKPDKPLPEFALKSALPGDAPLGFGLPGVKVQLPIESLGNAASGLGHLNQARDFDGALRSEYLLVDYYGRAIPSFPLMAAAKSLNLGPQDIKADPANSRLRVGKLQIVTDETGAMYPHFYKQLGDKKPFPMDSFYDVLNGKVDMKKYEGKLVFIGATAAGVGVEFPTPVSGAMTPVETVAHIASSILSEHFIVAPTWGVWVSLAALLLVAAYLIGLLPRLSAGMGASITGVLFVVLLVAEWGLLSQAALWVKLVLPAALLILGHLALTTKRFLSTEQGKARSDEESAETNRMLGLALQGQGQLDMAFDKFRRVPFNEVSASALMDNLYSLALDFERKRQFNKAQSVYEHMATHDRKYKDLEAKLNRAKNLSETVILGGGAQHAGGTMLLDNGAVEKPMLGRYQVEKELGKGAMGVVYLGKDPKIGRVVAIKTMALAQEFEGEELDDARERFFREAETAGRLQHQNIVTIFDAGEEHDLAYIAMEFLKGRDLVDFTKDGALLPLPQAVSIIQRVAQALAYAHKQNVVHRDIKPANIMYDPTTDTVKVTDFGIARITDSSKTKTGLVLGTPSFMSPEQIAGKKVDGRSDLYSLGVTLYQMLTGVLPFRGDSMAELMYKIANEAAPDIRVVRSDISPALAAVVARSLAKNVDERYADGDQFAADLSAAVGGSASSGTAAVAVGAHSVASTATAPEQATQVMRAAPADEATQVIPASPKPSGHEPTQVFQSSPAHAPASPPGGFESTLVQPRTPDPDGGKP